MAQSKYAQQYNALCIDIDRQYEFKDGHYQRRYVLQHPLAHEIVQFASEPDEYKTFYQLRNELEQRIKMLELLSSIHPGGNE